MEAGDRDGVAIEEPASGLRVQTKGFQRPTDILHPSHCYHPIFPTLNLLGITHLAPASCYACSPHILATPRLQTTGVQHPCDVLHTSRSHHPVFPTSIFLCHSPSPHILLRLSPRVPVAPHYKQPVSNIPVVSCTPHVALIPSFLTLHLPTTLVSCSYLGCAS